MGTSANTLTQLCGFEIDINTPKTKPWNAPSFHGFPSCCLVDWFMDFMTIFISWPFLPINHGSAESYSKGNWSWRYPFSTEPWLCQEHSRKINMEPRHHPIDKRNIIWFASTSMTLGSISKSRWWFQWYFYYFDPCLWKMFHFDLRIFFRLGGSTQPPTMVIFQATCLNPILHLQETCLPDVWPHLDIAKTLAMQLEAPVPTTGADDQLVNWVLFGCFQK